MVPVTRYRGKVGRLPGRRIVEDIVQNEELFPFQSLAKDIAAQALGGVLGALGVTCGTSYKNSIAGEGVGKGEERK